MTKREYVIKAIEKQTTDRVPFCIEIGQDIIELYGDRLLRDFPDKSVLEDLEEGLLSLREAIDLSIGNYIMRSPVHWWFWDRENTDPSYFDPGAEPGVMPATTREDTEENLENDRLHCKWLAGKYQTYMVSFIYASHWEKANSIRGIEYFLADIAGAPEFAQALLDHIIRQNMNILPKIVDNEYTDAVLFGSDWGTQNDLFMSPETWDRIIMPGEKVQYDLVKASGKRVMVHSCGCIHKILPKIIGLGVDVLNPVQPECMDLERLKETYGADLTFWGGVSTQRTLPYGAPDDVRKEVERVIKLMSKNGGYITGPSQFIQADVPYDNLKALIETARHYS